jgi:hypothetical protein
MGRPLPVRTTADTNSPNDVNTLSSAIEDMIDGSTAFESITFTDTTGTAGLHTDGGVLKYQGATIATGGAAAGQGIPFKLGGNAYVGTKQTQIIMGGNATIDKVIIYADTAPGGSTLSVDVNKNGTTIFTTQSKRPQIPDGSNTADSDTPDVTALAQDDRVSIDVDAVGSNTAGGDDLLVTVVFT